MNYKITTADNDVSMPEWLCSTISAVCAGRPIVLITGETRLATGIDVLDRSPSVRLGWLSRGKFVFLCAPCLPVIQQIAESVLFRMGLVTVVISNGLDGSRLPGDVTLKEYLQSTITVSEQLFGVADGGALLWDNPDASHLRRVKRSGLIVSEHT